MKKILLLFLFGLSALFTMQAQINSNSPATPFGSRTSYSNGIMPSNLPSGGTYGASQAAADAYNAWKTKFVVTCSGSGSRVLFDDGSSTVSEGIGYGMLLSAYAGDKPTFDLLWQFYKAHENGKGLMNWKYSNCTTIASGGQNGATDADEDAAMALIVANSQWPTATSPYTYKTEATTLLTAIRLNEFSSNYQPVNGDGWGTTNACRNPSYMAPAYYTEFASFDVTNSSFWTSCASAVNTVLLGNRNATTGLVSNWCSNTTPYADNNCNNSGNGYGYDACRNPWRMSVDVLWHGSAAVAASSDICSKLSTWLKGYESSLKGPYSNQTAANPSAGQYANGSFSTFALAPMATSSTNQSSLNSCYSGVVNLYNGNNDTYFNQTIRCISLFTLTGNFWKPGSTVANVAPTFTSATTNATGTTITVNFSIPITFTSTDYSKFTLKVGGTAVASAITAIATNGTSAVDLTIAAGKIVAGSIVTIDYTPGTIKSTAATPLALAAFTAQPVTNALAGNSTIIFDAEEANATKLLTYWFSYKDIASTTVTPLTDATTIFTMTAPGANGTANAAKINYTLNGSATLGYQPFAGMGMAMNDPEAAYDLTGSTGITFYYKSDNPLNLEINLTTIVDDCNYYASLPAATTWTKKTLTWSQFAQYTGWGTVRAWDLTKINKFQWKVQSADGTTGNLWVDEVQIDGKVLTLPVATTIDKTILATTITSATTLYTNAVEGTLNGNYPSGSKAILLSAITAATSVNTSTTVVQADVDAAVTALNTAITTFQGKVIVIAPTNTIIFDAEEANATKLLTYWFSYKDAATTTVTPLTDATTIFTMTAPGANGTANAAKINYTLNGSATLGYQPFAGMGMAMNDPEAAYDLTGSTGITFYYKSDNPLNLEINLTTIVDDCNYYASLPAATTWTKKTLTWSQFAQYTGWGTVRAWDLTKINKFQWKVQSADGTTGNLWVDEVQIDGLALKLPVSTIIDKSALASAITSANNAYNKAVEGLANGQYPSGSKATLLAAITSASTVNTNTSATQVQVNTAVTTLDSALLAFQNSIIVVLKTNLVNAINTANSDYLAAVEGSGNGQYPTGSKATLLSAINAATTVNTNILATQAQVDTAISTLNTAISTFQNSKIVVSKAALITALANANSTYSTAVEGSGNGQYPTGSKATLLSAINAATTVNTNTSASQTEVNTAVATLDTALSNFQNSVIGVKRSNLLTDITNAQTIHDAATEGNVGGDYPSGSKETLQLAINAANAVYINAGASQSDVNSAETALTTAISTFENSIIQTDKTALNQEIIKAQSIHDAATEGSTNGQYATGSKAILQSAINTATVVNVNSLVSQADVDTALSNLKAAVIIFQNSIIGINRATLQDKISEVTTTLILESGNTGTSIGNYSQTAWNTLSSTNTAAQSLVNNSSATQDQINAQLASLTLALTTFENSKITTAVLEVSNDPTIVYPNPCSDVLHIKSSKTIARITVINLLGIVQQSTILNDVNTLPVLTLSNGLYFISIQYGDGTVETVKFTKE